MQELLDILDPRSAPAVDRLVIIAHDHHLALIAGQHADPRVLNAVGILELVHQNIGKTAAIMLQNRRFVQPQFVGAQQQFGKIDQSGAITGFLISLIDFQPYRFGWVAVGFNVRRAQPLVFLAVDVPRSLTRRPMLFIQIHGFDQTLQ